MTTYNSSFQAMPMINNYNQKIVHTQLSSIEKLDL